LEVAWWCRLEMDLRLVSYGDVLYSIDVLDFFSDVQQLKKRVIADIAKKFADTLLNFLAKFPGHLPMHTGLIYVKNPGDEYLMLGPL
jgi:hypothetical protein